jgi:hypothetical protein
MVISLKEQWLQRLGIVQEVQEGVSGDLSTDGLVKNLLDKEMYAHIQIVHTRCLMKWPNEI